MSNEVRIGGVTARFNEDGTLYLYQPDSNRALSAELADRLVAFLSEGVLPSAFPENVTVETVPSADAFMHTRGPLEGQPIEPAEDEDVPVLGPPITLKQLREMADAVGVSPAGSKAQIIARMAKHGH